MTKRLTAPSYALKDKGAEIALASQSGGQPPNVQIGQTRRFKADREANRLVPNTAKHANARAPIESCLGTNKPVALSCHAPGVLRHVTAPDRHR
jgi:putative intracellular protease/amidase